MPDTQPQSVLPERVPPRALSYAVKRGLYLLASGESRDTVAALTGLHPDYISTKANSPEGRSFIESVEVEARRTAATVRIAGLALAAVRPATQGA